MDITQTLKDTENTLRDFVASVLSRSIGPDWIAKCGVSEDRIKKWKDRKEIEQKRQESGVVEERLIYYADFYDLKTILKKNWSGDFSTAFGDWKTMEVWFTELEKMRDPDAHRRELLPHQKHLALGIAGEIRTRLIRFRSKRETSEDCFPRIECIRDSLGNIWIPQEDRINMFKTNTTLHPGDTIDLVVTASDPEELPLQYGIRIGSTSPMTWQNNGTFSISINEDHIGTNFVIELFIKSPRSYHASVTYDDSVMFVYTVLPSKQSN